MARLRQQHPQNYGTLGTFTDFGDVIRYINSAELGDKTVSELLRILLMRKAYSVGRFKCESIPKMAWYRVGQYASIAKAGQVL